MAKMNLSAKGNALKTALAEFCKREWYVARQRYILKGQIAELENLVVSMDKADGTVVSYTDEQKADARKALEEKQMALEKLPKKEEAKYEYTDADKRLRKAWRTKPAISDRCYAVQAWLKEYGLDCELGQAMTIAKKLGGETIKSTSLESVALDNKNYTEDKLSINMKLLYKYMIDLHADAGCWSPNLIPEDLRDAWKVDREEAKKRKETAKKANK